MAERKGILAGGNFIVDHVKMIDHYPAQDMLATIHSESASNGGGPYNLLKDLAAMKAGFPLEAVGLIGLDADGQWILQDCRKSGINTDNLKTTDQAHTSYTDAMTVASTGRRTFFHQHGANAWLDESGFCFKKTPARIFHLAYLLLLNGLDRLDANGLTGASRVLEKASAAGLITTADCVSIPNSDFRRVVAASAPHIDILILNEVETGLICGKPLRQADRPLDRDAAAEACRSVFELGIRREIVLHFEEGALVLERGGAVHSIHSLKLPDRFIAGATGAGDAFAAGYLYGLHENWPIARRLELSVCTAAACLSHPTPSGGLQPIAQCLELGEKFGPQTGA